MSKRRWTMQEREADPQQYCKVGSRPHHVHGTTGIGYVRRCQYCGIEIVGHGESGGYKSYTYIIQELPV